MLWLTLLACGEPRANLGDFELTFGEGGRLTVTHATLGPVIEDLAVQPGTGTDAVEMSFGSFRWPADDTEVARGLSFGKPQGGRTEIVVVDLRDESGEIAGNLVFAATEDALWMDATGSGTDNRLRFSAACDADDHFLGLGGHAMDVDHVGQAFPLWVSEPGIGKTEDEFPPVDWYLTGTRHASSYPVPFLLRPHRGAGIWLDTPNKIDLDLCATDPARFSATVWSGSARVGLFRAPSALQTVQAYTAYAGRPELPQPWVFAPWNDAVKGSARVLEVARTLREAGAPSSVIWTEDWKGAEQTSVGYHLTGEWDVDRDLYPDVEDVDAALEAEGFAWYAYFAPFVRTGYRAWDEAEAAGVLIQHPDGGAYEFSGVAFRPESMLDLTNPAAVTWAQDRMNAALDVGFDGWMADYAEWLPTDAVLASGESAWDVHNIYPELWQQTNAEVMEGRDASFFVRSGWSRTAGIVPVVWAGDQRTSFDADDGLPSVVVMGLSMSASGVPIYTHDVAGYQSIGNAPTTKELWFRWAALGAYSPILRTHHGAFADDNWQFDSDEETTAFWARMAREHTALWPYRYALAKRASEEGIPMILPPAFRFADQPWGRKDAWLLGDDLLVAPVVEAGATSREVALPEGVWHDWRTGQRVTSGEFAAPVTEIPVFARGGSVIPLFDAIPDSLRDITAPGRITREEAETQRLVRVFGTGGTFTEADGTSYTVSGTASSGEGSGTFSAGEVVIGGLTVQISSPVERTFRVVAYE